MNAISPAAPPPSARTACDYFTYTAKLMMRGGLHQVAVGVTDQVGCTSSFLRQSVRLGRRQ